MLTLTDKAATKVKEFITAQSDAEEVKGIRISVIGGGCSGFQYAMNLEREDRPSDQVIAVNGFAVYVDEQSLLYLSGTEIDFVETPQGAGFHFKNPNVKSTCGCGESFKA
jgi:iron-sulfur cluster assembly accessory protein